MSAETMQIHEAIQSLRHRGSVGEQAVADWLESVYQSAFPPGWNSDKDSGRTIANVDWDHAITVARAHLETTTEEGTT